MSEATTDAEQADEAPALVEVPVRLGEVLDDDEPVMMTPEAAPGWDERYWR